ncbi:Teichoic acids export ATP-binding protein TagH [bioreactor metagenome]|uniref:Teichoic acids export ATP-binding protein TagH n=1 Tax=bioreactor metagenome TaxID=1076179 RepID=A0A644XDF5_9ZZZZ
MTIINAQHVTMTYRLTKSRVKSIKEYMVSFFSQKLQYEEFQALDNVSLQVEQGEVIGLIGRNGAGKSTMLKVISGVLRPTSGTISVHGSVVPMLELGSGFDFELSGRENIFLNGAILGYDKSFLESKYQEILEFSELQEFIDQPIRTYSSGMMMRLAFSIATVVEPEILIIDEILAVGDADFQTKSYRRMLELMSGGTTVLLVSHNLDQIRELCDRVVWLDHGRVKVVGSTREVCDAYANL